MATEHVNIVDSERHEPKGADAALSKQVYVSDGATSGAWTYREYVVNTTVTDISTIGDRAWVVMPIAGKITRIYSIIDGAIITSDATLTFEINNIAVVGASITIATAGSAAGDKDSSTPTSANTVAAGDILEVITDGLSGNVVSANISILVEIQ